MHIAMVDRLVSESFFLVAICRTDPRKDDHDDALVAGHSFLHSQPR